MNRQKYKQTFSTIVLGCLAVYAHAENQVSNPHETIGLNSAVAAKYTGRGVKVGVVDAGFLNGHPLANTQKQHAVKFTLTNPQGKQEHFDPNVDELEEEDDDENGSKRQVYSMHGSQVAGVIGAKPFKGLGYAGGVAQNADIYTVAYEAHDTENSEADLPKGQNTFLLLGDSPAARYARLSIGTALKKAADAGVFAINNSWNEDAVADTAAELDAKYRSTVTRDRTNPLTNTIRQAASDGKLLVFATGNEGKKQPGALAALPRYLPELEKHYLAVTAVDENGGPTAYANHCGVSKNWCVAAPGNLTVLSATPAENGEKEYGLSLQQGTSLATPAVTGSLALLKERFHYFTPSQVRDTLLTTATDLGEKGIDEQYGWGLVNLADAVKGPKQLLGDETYTVSGSDVWSNTLTAEHTLTKQGAGALSLNGQNNRIKNIQANAGRLALNGSTSADRVENRAVLAAADLTVNRLFRNEAGATLEISGKPGITAQGNGTVAELDGTLAVNPILLENTAAGGTAANVLTVKNGASYRGGFEQLAPSPQLAARGLRQDVYFTDNNIAVKVNENKAFTDPQANANAQSGLAALNRLRDSKTALRKGVYNSWLQQAADSGNLQNFHYHIGNGIYADSLEYLRSRTAGRLNSLNGRLHGHRLLAEGETRLWLEQEHEKRRGRQTDYRETPETTARRSGLGVAHKAGGSVLLAASLAHTRADTEKPQASSQTKQTELGLAVRYMPQPTGWFAEAGGSAARINYRQNRRFGQAQLASGKNSGHAFGAAARTGYSFERNGWQFEPAVGLQAVRLNMKRLAENGELPTSTAAFKQTDLNLETGLRVKKTISAGGWNITPHAELSHIRRLNSGNTAISSRLEGSTFVNSTATVGGKRQTALGLGLAVGKNKWFASAAYSHGALKNDKANSWQARIGLVF